MLLLSSIHSSVHVANGFVNGVISSNSDICDILSYQLLGRSRNISEYLIFALASINVLLMVLIKVIRE